MCLSGCATLDRPSGYYQQAALNALYDPYTIVPLTGSVVFTLGDFDQQTSDWAQRKTPIFGSAQDALDASDRLRYTVDTAASLMILAAPVNDDENWLYKKSIGFLNASVSHSITLNLTGVLKRETRRDRPNGSGSLDSFPSAHSSTAWNYASVGRRFNHESTYSDGIKQSLDIGMSLAAAGVSWARVEGGVHYPSDVLFGAALGNFFGLFVYDSFLGAHQSDLRITFNSNPQSRQIFLSGRF